MSDIKITNLKDVSHELLEETRNVFEVCKKIFGDKKCVELQGSFSVSSNRKVYVKLIPQEKEQKLAVAISTASSIERIKTFPVTKFHDRIFTSR